MSSDKRDAIGVSYRAKRLGYVDFLAMSYWFGAQVHPPPLSCPTLTGNTTTTKTTKTRS